MEGKGVAATKKQRLFKGPADRTLRGSRAEVTCLVGGWSVRGHEPRCYILSSTFGEMVNDIVKNMYTIFTLFVCSSQS